VAIDKPLSNRSQPPLLTQPAYSDTVMLEEDEVLGGTQIEETEDGGMLINFDPSESESPLGAFDSNLAETMEETDLNDVAIDLIGNFGIDKSSRSDWEKTYKEGVDLLGLSIEERTEPWDGASGITHPILAEAVVRFQSQAIGEIFPEGGAVKVKVVGKYTPEKQKQSIRVQDHMNYMVEDEMVEYREEMDRLLFALPVAGSAFKKVYNDEELGRLVAVFVPAEDLVVSFGATSLHSATRVTEIMRKSSNWIKKRVVSGFYRDVDLQTFGTDDTDVKDKLHETVGETRDTTDDDTITLLECHVDLDLVGYEDSNEGEQAGIALPYVVTIDAGSRQVLSIYRNWMPDDEKKVKRQHFTHYQYIPGFGFYGLGLVDAGSLANLPAGYKSRGMRIKGDNTPLAPGEFRDVDVPSGKISDHLMPLPYKEPSQVLFALLGAIVEEGRRFASITDMNVSSQSQEAPVGTTLALLERDMKVTQAIQGRLHRSLKDEFKILVILLQGIPNKVYPYEVEGGSEQMEADFDGRVDAIPVSDPNSATASHRIMKAQAAVQMSAMAPQEFKLKPLFRYALESMGIPDAKEMVPLESDILALDPVTENMNVLNMEPVKAFIAQDHQSHIQVHMMGMQDPKVTSILANSPHAQASAAAMMSHITEHVAYQYRSEIEQTLGTQLPPMGEELPPEIEADYSRLVAEAATNLFQRNSAEKQAIDNEAAAKDPLNIIRNRELDLEETEAIGKLDIQKQRLDIDRAKLLQKDEQQDADRTQRATSDSERVRGDLLGNVLRAASETESLDQMERIKLVELMIEQIKTSASEIKLSRPGDNGSQRLN